MHPALAPALAASFFSKLPPDIVEPVLAHGGYVETPSGLVVTVEQAQGQVALVLSGLFRCFVRGKNDRQATVAYAREGEMIGLPTLFVGTCRMGLQSLTPGAVWAMPGEVLKQAAMRDARLAWALGEEIGRYTFDMACEIADTTFGTVRQRVARHLLDLVVEGPADAPLVAPVSQQELANAVGTAREVVSRVLSAFRSEGLVRATQAGLEVLDATQLYQQSQIVD
jgi:CRP/FNR family cyclic AMP-dependent transcriptional regulator